MAGSENVGEVTITVSADDTELIADLKKTEKTLLRKLRDIGEKGGDQLTGALNRSTSKGMVKVRRQLKKLEEKLKAKLEVEPETAKARAALRRLARDRTVNLWLRVRSTKAASQFKSMISSLSGFKMMTGWIAGSKNMIHSLPNLAITLAQVGTAIGALVPPIGSALTSIAPLASSLAAIGPLALAGVPGIIGMATAMQILTVSFEDLDKSAAPAAKAFNRELTTLQARFSTLKTAIQQRFFSGDFYAAFQKATKLFPAFSKGVQGVATALSDTLGAGIRGVVSAMAGGGMETMFTNIAKMFENSEGGMKAFGKALGTIAVKASPALATLGDEFTKLGEKFGKWVEKSNIGEMVDKAIDATKQLFYAVGQAWSIVKGLFKSMDTGKSTGLESVGAALKRVADIVNGEQFQTTMQTIFTGMNKGAQQLSAALGPIGDNFSKMAPTLSKIFETLGGTAAAAITGITTALADPAAQEGLLKAIEGIDQLVKGIDWAAVGAAVGSIGTSIGNIAPKVAAFVNALLPYIPGIMSFVDQLVNMLGMLPPELILAGGAAIKFGGAFGKISKGLGKFKLSPRQLATFARLGGIAPKITFLARAFMKVSPALRAVSIGMRLVGVAMRFMLGPVGIVITILGLLVAGFIYAYTHSETFRSVVDSTVAAIGSAFTWLWTNAIAPALSGIMKLFAMIIRGIAGMLRAFGQLPGQEWAKGAADAMDGLATSVEGASEAITKVPDPKVDTGKSQKEVKALDKEIKGLEDKIVTARAKGDNKGLKDLQKKLKDAERRKYELEVKAKITGQKTFNFTKTGETRFALVAQANGGIVEAFAKGGLLKSFASGGVLKAFASGAENHIAQIARPGAMRLWAEPETGGESYIPLAFSKRKRSLAIWEETGRRLGALGPSLQDGIRKIGQTNSNEVTNNYSLGGVPFTTTAKEARVIEEYVALAKRKARAAGANGRAVNT